jgi:hypothetical protein
MDRGYIKLYRAVMDNFIWKKKPFSYGQAWAHIIMLANHKEGTVWVQGTPVKIKRGQLGWSKENLQKTFGWTRSKLRTFIKHLKSDHMISHDSAGKLSIITILNYERYHGNDQADDQTIAKSSPSDDQAIAINNKNKNNKKNKKEYITPFLGEHGNVKMTKDEHAKLHEKIGKTMTIQLVEELSGYIASTGKKYKSHYATVLVWSKKKNNEGTTRLSEAEQIRLKNALIVAQGELERAQERQPFEPGPKIDKYIQDKQREVNQLKKKLEG